MRSGDFPMGVLIVNPTKYQAVCCQTSVSNRMFDTDVRQQTAWYFVGWSNFRHSNKFTAD